MGLLFHSSGLLRAHLPPGQPEAAQGVLESPAVVLRPAPLVVLVLQGAALVVPPQGVPVAMAPRGAFALSEAVGAGSGVPSAAPP